MNIPNPVSFPQNVFIIPIAKKITPKIQLTMFQKIDLFVMIISPLNKLMCLWIFNYCPDVLPLNDLRFQTL